MNDYGLKVYSDDDNPYEFVNAKYQLFGTDLGNKTPQFKTYFITLTGYDTKPTISWPAYIEDGVFYQGNGVRKKQQATIETGFSPDTIKSINISVPAFTSSNYKGMAHQYQTGSSGSYDNDILPTSVSLPNGLDKYSTKILFRENYNFAEMSLTGGSGGYTEYNTLGSFNGGSLTSLRFDTPEVFIKMDSSGKLVVSTQIQYNWIQRALTGGYRVRWVDWVWYQGIVLQVTILNTPYIL